MVSIQKQKLKQFFEVARRIEYFNFLRGSDGGGQRVEVSGRRRDLKRTGLRT